MKIEVPNLSVKLKPETSKKLLEDPIEQMNFVIEQKEKIEAALTDEEKQDPLIAVKLRALDQAVERFKDQLIQMGDICMKASATVNEAREVLSDKLAENTESHIG